MSLGRSCTRIRLALFLAALVPLGAATFTCTTGDTAGTGGGGSSSWPSTTSTSSSTTTTTSGGGGQGGEACDPLPIPAVVPAGWQDWSDWSCDCRFYVPGSAAVLPPPLAWEPCPNAPAGLECRRLVLGQGEGLFVVPGIDRTAQGGAILDLILSKAYDYSYHLVAEADGPVRSAMMLVWGGKAWTDLTCTLDNEGFCEGHFLHQVNGWKDPLKLVRGAVGGITGELQPTALSQYVHPNNDPLIDSWGCSANWITRLGYGFVLSAYPWDMSSETIISSPGLDPEGLDANEIIGWRDAVFFRTGQLGIDGINVWTPTGGTKPFVRWMGDYTKGAGDLGTDGVDLVWAYGEGKEPSAWDYPVRSVMTAPFTTDPAALQPRRLRSNPALHMGTYTFEVGCGYAVHDAASIYIVRLADGTAWFLDDTPDIKFTKAVGLTCDEVFVTAVVSGSSTLTRIQLSSLGPGLPPD